jgi:hypothetical protein
VDRWVVEEWTPCSKTCGKLGYQSRVVQCLQSLHNGTTRPVHAKHCSEERPELRRTCNSTVCPAQWRTGAWSQVGLQPKGARFELKMYTFSTMKVSILREKNRLIEIINDRKGTVCCSDISMF